MRPTAPDRSRGPGAPVAADAGGWRSLGASGEAGTSLALLRAPVDVPRYGRFVRLVDSSRSQTQVLVPVPPPLLPGDRDDGASFLMIDTPSLLDELGLVPTRLNGALVSQLVAQGAPLSEAVVRQLRRTLGRLGGSAGDAGAAVLLARLGLPMTDGTLAIARRLVAGQHDPVGAWRDALAEFQHLADPASEYVGPERAPARDQASVSARELLRHWTPPDEEHGPSLATWLRSVVGEAATAPEARIGRRPDADVPGGQPLDARTELAEVQHLLARSPRWAEGAASRAVERLQDTLLAEQALNAAPQERTEPRVFAVTIPIVRDDEPGAIELSVRERERREGADGDPSRPDVAHVKLELPTLGELHITLTVNHPRIACQFAAESPFAEALLRASAGDLVTHLEGLGYRDPAIGSSSTPSGDGESHNGPAPLVARRVRRVDLRA